MRYVLLMIFHGNIVNFDNILIYTTNQHKKCDNIYFEHFPQNSKLTLDRPHRIRRAPVDQVTHRVCRALDRGQAHS